jgi:hypothetical protein
VIPGAPAGLQFAGLELNAQQCTDAAQAEGLAAVLGVTAVASRCLVCRARAYGGASYPYVKVD